MNPIGHAALSFNPYGANKSLDEHQWMALSLITALIPFSHTIQLMNINLRTHEYKLRHGVLPTGILAPCIIRKLLRRYLIWVQAIYCHGYQTL